MKTLKRVLLINWHSFSKELIDIGNINFLTGKNAVGKSTIVDAIQLVILGDTRGTSFNKAASEKSGRTVISYLKGEIGGDENGNKKYMRDGEFASYVALEFYDDVNEQPFVIGIQFDVIGDKCTPHQFIYDGEIPEEAFIADKHAMTFKPFKDYVSIAFKNVLFPESLATYKEEMRKKLGQLSQRFFALFKKAVPFQPIYDIRKFITEFVCDVKYDIKKDLEEMQENVRNYTSLEVEAKNIQSKIIYLQRIKEYYDAYALDKNKVAQVEYLVSKLEIAKKKKDIVSLNEQINNHQSRYDEISSEETNIQNDVESWNNVRDRLIGEKQSNDATTKQDNYNKQKESVNRDIDSIKDTFNKSCNRLVQSFNEFVDKAKSVKCYDFDREFANEAGIDVDQVIALCDTIIKKGEVLALISAENVNKYSENQIMELSLTINSLEDIFNKARMYAQAANSAYIEKKNEYLSTIETLKNGKKRYPTNLVEFKDFVENELYKRHNKHIELNFIADLMEIKNKRWQAVIENFLHNQKFTFIVDNEYFQEVLNIYNENRNRFSDVAVLDAKKVFSRAPFNVVNNALSEEIETDNKYVRAYIDMLVGQVVKVERVEDLNKFDRAIMSTGMLYQQFTARQMNLSRNNTPFIGKRATESQIEGYLEEIEVLNRKLDGLKDTTSVFFTLCRFNNITPVDIHYHYANLQQIYRIDELNAELLDINNKIESIDMSDVQAIEEKIEDVNGELRFANNSLRQIAQEKGSILAKIEELKVVKLSEAQRALAAKEAEVASKYTSEWILANVSDDMQEMLAYISDDQISKKLAESRRIADNLGYKRRQLEKARMDYMRTFNVSIDTSDDNNDKFNEELEKYEQITLPQYQAKIAQAKEKTYDEFKEDLLAKLKTSIESVQEQITTLNVSLAAFQFGRDKYEFLVRPNPTYQRTYDMIMDELLMQDSRNNSQAFYEKYKDTIDDFFAAITEAPGANDEERREIIDKNIERYTDYRTYLDFDLLVHNQETNSVQSLANSMGTKSGGETQTPFYISILASIASEYRIGFEDVEANTPRLILFDEAFNKMDSERIKESIELLKKFHLQAILVAPPEKVSDIAPLVDRNLCVIRRKNTAFVKCFEKSDIEALAE